MNSLVKITRDDDGYLIDDPKWCLLVHYTGNMAFCSGQFVGVGESACEYEIKEVIRGGITCQNCIDKIKGIKAVKL